MLYRLEYVRCGKRGCWCSGSIGAAAGRRGHGPYWYGYWIEQGARGPKLRKVYVGKKLPELRTLDRVAYEAEQVHAQSGDPALSAPPPPPHGMRFGGWRTFQERGAGAAGGR